jgi:phosphate starvation-inducible protein PhoH
MIYLKKGVNGVGEHIFGNKDIVRAKILQEVVDRYDKWRIDNPEK